MKQKEYMEQGNKLVDIAASDHRWGELAEGIQNENWDLSLVIEDEAEWLRGMVLSGRISISEVRDGVRWASALDKEAVERYGSDLSQNDQVAERTARRVMHLAGRSALKAMRSQRLRTIARAEVARMPSMGWPEGHDMRDSNLVQ